MNTYELLPISTNIKNFHTKQLAEKHLNLYISIYLNFYEESFLLFNNIYIFTKREGIINDNGVNVEKAYINSKISLQLILERLTLSGTLFTYI